MQQSILMHCVFWAQASKTELLLQLQLHTLLLQRRQNRVSVDLDSANAAEDDSRLCTAAWALASTPHLEVREKGPAEQVFFPRLVDCLCALQERFRLSPTQESLCCDSSASAAQTLQCLTGRSGAFTAAFGDLVSVTQTDASLLPQLALVFFEFLCRSSLVQAASSERVGAGAGGETQGSGAARESCCTTEDANESSYSDSRVLHRGFQQLLRIAYPPRFLLSQEAPPLSTAARGGLNALLLLCAAHPSLHKTRRRGVVADCRTVIRAVLRTPPQNAADEALKPCVDWRQLLELLPLAASEGACEATPADDTGSAGACAGVATAIGAFLCEVQRSTPSPGALSPDLDANRCRRSAKDFSSAHRREAVVVLDGLVDASVDCCFQLLKQLPVRAVEAISPEAQALFFAAPGEVFYGAEGKPLLALNGRNAASLAAPGRNAAAAAKPSAPRHQGSAAGGRKGVGGAGGSSGFSKVASRTSPGGSGRSQQQQQRDEELRQQQTARRRIAVTQQQCTRSLDFLGSLLLGCGTAEATGGLLASPAFGEAVQDKQQTTPRLLPALEALLRCSVTNSSAFRCLECAVFGCISRQLLPRRALLPQALQAIQLGRDFFAAAAELLETAHGESLFSIAAAALLLPLVAAVLTEAASANATVCRQALLLLLQQLKLHSPLKPDTVVQCLGAVLRAHPSLVSSGEEALCLCAEYLLQPQQVESLVLLAASTTTPGRRAVSFSLRRAPVSVLQQTFRLASTCLRTLAQDPSDTSTRQAAAEQLERLLKSRAEEAFAALKGEAELEALVEFLAAPSEVFRDMASRGGWAACMRRNFAGVEQARSLAHRGCEVSLCVRVSLCASGCRGACFPG